MARIIGVVFLYGALTVQVAHSAGPIWSIGAANNSADEFSPGSARSLVYDTAVAGPKDWRERIEADQRYVIRFHLTEAPGAAVLAIEGFLMEAGPDMIEVVVNGRRGTFRVTPLHGKDLDMRQGSILTHTRVSLRVPIQASFLKPGANEIALSVTGEGGGTVYFDWLALERPSKAAAGALDVAVEPTIFFRRADGQLKEVTRIIIHHSRPLKNASFALKAGPFATQAGIPDDGSEFGERVVELDLPAFPSPQPYELTLTTSEGAYPFRGTYRPEKRWKLFAAPKIHNDIGYTDLQQSVEELDNRNTDRAIDFIARFPFYKFNLEVSWLAENYLNSRTPPRIRQLVDLAKGGQIGVGGLYLNLLTGLATGEEMYRALYFSAALRRKYGIPVRAASLTDTPSHPWSLPSLLADAGIRGFALASNQHRGALLINSTLNEDSPFYWEGPDGRRVIAFFSRSYQHLDRISGAKPSAARMRRAMAQALARYRRPECVVDAIYLFGQSTDNADLRLDGPEAIREWNNAYEYPKLAAATDAEYFDYIEKNFSGKLPVYRGDGGSYWHDAAGSSAAFTVKNRDSQRLLPLAETLFAWASLLDSRLLYPAPALRSAWNEVLFYDEHTWGAHNSISQPDRSFVTSQFEFKKAHAERGHWAANDLLIHAMNRMAQFITVEKPVLLVFNPGLNTRSDIVEAEYEPNRSLVDVETGRVIPTDVVSEQQGWRRVRFLAEDVPGLGYRAYEIRPEKAAQPMENKAVSGAWEIDSRFYSLALDPKTGAVSRLVDKEVNRDLVDPGAPFRLNELVYSAGGEGQQIVRNVYPNGPTTLEVTGQRSARLVENVRTPLGQRIRIQARAVNVPLIESEILLYDRIKRVDIRNRIRKDDVRAKEAIYFAFPFRVSPPELQYQVHNAWARPNDDQLPGACREWFTTQNLVLSKDAGMTVAFATPDLPLVTLTDINRGRWLQRLDIRNGHVYSYVTNNYWSTNIRASQAEEIAVRYSLTSGKTLDLDALGRFDAETRSALAAYAFFDGRNVRDERGKKALPAGRYSLFEVAAGNAQITAFKQAEDGNGYILRLRETSGREGTARLNSPFFRIAQAYAANGVEENQAPLPARPGGIDIPLKPRQFTTIRLLFEPLPPGGR